MTGWWRRMKNRRWWADGEEGKLERHGSRHLGGWGLDQNMRCSLIDKRLWHVFVPPPPTTNDLQLGILLSDHTGECLTAHYHSPVVKLGCMAPYEKHTLGSHCAPDYREPEDSLQQGKHLQRLLGNLAGSGWMFMSRRSQVSMSQAIERCSPMPHGDTFQWTEERQKALDGEQSRETAAAQMREDGQILAFMWWFHFSMLETTSCSSLSARLPLVGSAGASHCNHSRSCNRAIQNAPWVMPKKLNWFP